MTQDQHRGPRPVRPAAVQPVAAKPPAELPVVEATAEAEEEAKPEGYTPQEAAQVLGGAEAGFTGKSIRRHIRGKVCPATKHSGRWYVTEEELTVYLDNLEAAEKAKAAKAAAEVAKAAAEQAEIPVPTP